MTTTVAPVKKEESNGSMTENKKGIDNHKKAASHYEEAAKHHHDAAKHHEAGDHAKAALSTIQAQGQHQLASEAQREDVMHHVSKS